jgi:uncharacterized SAM-binding protein YcdF (DUF218 family)
MKTNRLRRISILAGAALLLLAGFAVNAGRILVVDEPQPSDLIVVLAGETDRRPARALQLLNEGYASEVMIDVPAAAKLYSFTETELAQRYVQSLPQAGQIVVCPIVGLSTKAEAKDIDRCLAGLKSARILIVTSDFHTRRARAILRRELPGRHWSVAAAYDETQFGTRWWTHRQWAKTCLDEWLRLVWWNAVDRWR